MLDLGTAKIPKYHLGIVMAIASALVLVRLDVKIGMLCEKNNGNRPNQEPNLKRQIRRLQFQSLRVRNLHHIPARLLIVRLDLTDRT